MKKNRFFFIGIIALQSASAQNVGIGTTTPAAKLDVKSSVSGYVAQFNGAAPMYMGIFENDIYRGYWGSYSGNAEDVDFGTGSGTTGKLHLTIQASPKLTIDNAGKVGIGTTIPNYKLHVTGGDIFLQTSSGYLKMGYDGSNQWRYATTGGGADLMMQTSPDGTTFTGQHYFEQSGNLGIGTGTTSPKARLDIKTSSVSSSTSAFMIRNSNNDTLIRIRDNGYVGIGYNGLSYGRPLNIEGTGMNFYYNVGTYGGSIFPNSDGSLNLWAPTRSINLQPTAGSVTIGTYTPAVGYLLSVDGKIICEELKVQLSTAWPDYVFENNYTLPSLEDLEKKVMEEKHLPNIPSANEVETAKGFGVGQMQNKLLEKVEELYRYVFQLNNENKAMKAEIKQLKGKRK